MKMIKIEGLHVIDDTYNASPEAVIAALEALAYLGGAHTAAVLGDIGELGDMAKPLHDAVGECAARSGVSRLFTYGHYADVIKAGALRGGMSAHAVHAFDLGEERALAACIRQVLPRGATVLFKASRKTALERVIKELGE
jgi:UDP-N-acetylmuramyl pentapeptide synthase